MERACKNCVYFATELSRQMRRAVAFARCCVTLRRVSSLMVGCSLHWSKQDQTRMQQEQDETWRPGATLPLAVPKQD